MFTGSRGEFTGSRGEFTGRSRVNSREFLEFLNISGFVSIFLDFLDIQYSWVFTGSRGEFTGSRGEFTGDSRVGEFTG